MTAPDSSYHSRLLWIVGAVLLDGCAAIFGAILRESLILRWKERFLAAAAGVMLGVAFLEVLPEALSGDGAPGLPAVAAGMTLLGGFFAFYLIEQLFSHGPSRALPGHEATEHEPSNPKTLGPSLLFGDALHNVSDGLAVATAFLSSIRVGVSLALAVFFHELPHETGDYAVLVAHGYSRKKALFWMFLIQMSALVGALGVYFMAGVIFNAVPWLLAFSAGGFVYIAAVKLLPAVTQGTGDRIARSVIFVAGILLAYALRFVAGS